MTEGDAREPGRAGAAVRVGVDIGGTFTDIVLERADGTLRVNKISSTPERPEEAVVGGLSEPLARAGALAAAVVGVVHGTTVASNSILERRGARTGLLTTRGFRDVLEIGRARTPELFDLDRDKPAPLVRRRHRLEADERIAADGAVVRPPDTATVAAAAERFAADGIESVAVCFINGYRNPAHERLAARLLRGALPDVAVTASSEVLPEIKEYERTSTTVVNAYVLPIMRRYLAQLALGLRAIGVRAPLSVVASNGGVVGAEAAGAKPVFVVGSGPAAGVTGAARLGRRIAQPSLIAFDMGGTTAKAALIENGAPCLTTEYEFRDGISTPSRFIKAGGHLLKVPAVDVAEVGSGGGSIAWIDAGGLLRVGPRSAGADPGPACYGRGGDAPTVTDANVVLGHLNPDALAGGRLRLDVRQAAGEVRAGGGAGQRRRASGLHRAHGARRDPPLAQGCVHLRRPHRRRRLLRRADPDPGHAYRPRG